MTIVVDSGSTKTDWYVLTEGCRALIKTKGINPVVQTDEEIETVITSEFLPLLARETGFFVGHLGRVARLSMFFYGAGCTKTNIPRMESLLRQAFGRLDDIEVNSDLLAAARALFGNKSGIACILGTGSNSCLYDGKRIMANTPPLGYILGDEGSGAVLGRMFLNGIFKGMLSQTLRDEYLSESGLSLSDIIEKVYRGGMPNKFLASTSYFISRHLDDEAVRGMVIDNFRRFFRNNIYPYNKKELGIGVVGSIAFVYEELLHEAAEREHLNIIKVLKSPINSLLAYHME